MGSEKDPEKMEDNEGHELESASAGSNGYPDFDHEEVEAMDAGHQADLAIQQVCLLWDGQQKLHLMHN